MGSISVDEHTITLGYTGPVHYRSAPAAGIPTLYLHGVPTSSEDWTAFLERTGGIAPDLIGFGSSSKGGHLDYSIAGLASFLAELLDHLRLDRVAVVAHQWGAAAAVQLTVGDPGRVERLALINPLPLIEGFSWPRLARWWRRPLCGELLMGATTKRMLARTMRRGSLSGEAWPAHRIDAVWEQFDQGTQRAILRLHRDTGEATLDRVLGELGPPTTILWGDRDPWLEAPLAEAYAARIPGAAIEHLDAGHWPWLDHPELVDRVAALVDQ